MGLFDKLLGKKLPPHLNEPAKAPTPNDADPSKDAGMIKVFDSFGREFNLTRQQWLDSVLTGNIQQAWNDPEKLSGLIINAFCDGFFAEMVKPAERLATIDSDHVRGATVLAIAYLKNGRLEDSERMLRDHIARHGESGVVLGNLAKIHAARSDEQKTLDTLWRALELDPNDGNCVGWYEVIHREKLGEAAGLAALRRIAVLPGSWRAQLWLARDALKHGTLEEALGMYRQSLSRAGTPVPTDLLMQMSGDLGNQGHLPESLNLTAPHFSAEVHGFPVGNNLIKTHLDLGQIDAACGILDQLYAQKRPDWREQLSFWDTEIAKVRVQLRPADPGTKLEMTLLTLPGPIWLKTSSPAAELFPVRSGNGPGICFFGATVERASNSKKVEHQLADASGRLSRAVPVFLAEQLHWCSDARVSTLIPWIAGPSGGFAVSGVPWEDAAAAGFARQGELKHDYAVTANLKTQVEPWTLELHVIRTIDCGCVGTLSASFEMAQPQISIPDLASKLCALLIAETGAASTPPPCAIARHLVSRVPAPSCLPRFPAATHSNGSLAPLEIICNLNSRSFRLSKFHGTLRLVHPPAPNP